MEQEPPDKFDGIERHQSLTVAMGIVFPPKGHPPIPQREEAPIRDRHAVCIACQILQHWLRATPGWLGIYHPLRGPQGAQELLPPRGLREGVALACQRQGTCRVRVTEPGEEETTEDPTQDTYGEKEGRATGLPVRPVGCEPTPRHHAVEVGMVTTTVTIP